MVFVWSLESAFYEKACGTGSTAVVIVESRQRQASFRMSVLQPSGSTIIVEAEVDNNMLQSARISGQVNRLRGSSLLQA